jgi:16S rRNA processing protein RimM
VEDKETPGGLLAVGRIIRPHGLRGAVIVEVLSDVPGRFRPGSELLMTTPAGSLEPVMVTGEGGSSGKALVQLEGIEDRDSAERLKGRVLYVPRDEAGELAEGEYWPSELEGMAVLDDDGERLGSIEDVIEGAAQDLLVIRDGFGNEILLPFVKEFVKGVDMGTRVVTVRLIEGMRPK